jgi:hypothetical protein
MVSVNTVLSVPVSMTSQACLLQCRASHQWAIDSLYEAIQALFLWMMDRRLKGDCSSVMYWQSESTYFVMPQLNVWHQILSLRLLILNVVFWLYDLNGASILVLSMNDLSRYSQIHALLARFLSEQG